jgi:hypothetical protein
MSDDTTDDVDVGSVSTNRLTVHDPEHLPAILGDDGRLQTQGLRVNTGDGWIEITPADGGVAVERFEMDPPEGSAE